MGGRTVALLPKFLVDNQIFLPMVLRCALRYLIVLSFFLSRGPQGFFFRSTAFQGRVMNKQA